MTRRFTFARPVWVLFAGTVVNRSGTFVLAFLALYMTRRGFSPVEAGLAVACYGVGSMFSSLVGGHLADRIGRRRAIAVSMFSGAAALLGLARAEGLPAIVALTAAVGFTTELYRPAASALILDLVEPAQHVTAFAVYRLAVNLGATIGPAIGGFLAERSFAYLFVADALTCAGFGAVALLWLPESHTGPHPHGQPGRYAEVLRDRMFVRFLIASTAIAVVYTQMNAGFALETAARGYSNAVYGGLIALNGLVCMLLELPIANVTRRLPYRPVIALGFMLVGVGFAATGFAAGVPMLAATVVVWTLGEIISMPVASAYVASLSPAHLRGRYQGAWGMSFALSWVIGPSLGGRLFAWGPNWLWVACGVVGTLSAAVVATGPPSASSPAVPPRGSAPRSPS